MKLTVLILLSCQLLLFVHGGKTRNSNGGGKRRQMLECLRHMGCTQSCGRELTACICHQGFRLLYKRICVDQDECRDTATCEHSCENIVGSYRCSCNTGYRLGADGRSCIEERSWSDRCRELGCEHFCGEDDAGNPACKCFANFVPRKNKCIRVCALGNGGCQHRCVTLNKKSKISKCMCRKGYTMEADGQTCRRKGGKRKKMRPKPPVDDSTPPVVPSCKYKNGNCSQGCDGTPLGPSCFCNKGFHLKADNRTCEDTDECLESGKQGCEHHCVNVLGSYRCSCREGYRLEGNQNTCIDINECEFNETCQYGCVNTNGSYQCLCPAGYELYSTKRCGDRNECAVNNGGCAHRCVNSIGSYHCKCATNYTLHHNGHDCMGRCQAERTTIEAALAQPPVLYRVRSKHTPMELDCSYSSRYLGTKLKRLPGFTLRCGERLIPSWKTKKKRGSRRFSRYFYRTPCAESRNVTFIERTFYAKSCLLVHDTNKRADAYRRKKSLKQYLGIHSVLITCRHLKQKRKKQGDIMRPTITVEIQTIHKSPNCRRNCAPSRSQMEVLMTKIADVFRRKRFLTTFSDQRMLLAGRPARPGNKRGGEKECPIGQAKSTPSRKCEPCEKGFYFVSGTKTCQRCPMNTYQDHKAQLSCILCPNNTRSQSINFSNNQTALNSLMKCRPRCQPGYFSRDGMVPCRPCPRGSYQPEYGRLGCKQCMFESRRVNTSQIASTSFSQCDMRFLCSRGHFHNKSSEDECDICPKDYYQPNESTDFCYKCPNGSTTAREGNWDLSQCQDQRCGGHFHARTGVIESPNYPGNYSANIECEWTITAESNRKILIVIPEIHIPFRDAKECDDVLRFEKDGDSEHPTINICQTFTSPMIHAENASSYRITFKSDHKKEWTGFQVYYATYKYDYHNIVQDIAMDGKLGNPDYFQYILKQQRTRRELFHVLADPHKYFINHYYNHSFTSDFFPKKFHIFLSEKIKAFLGLTYP